MPYEMATERPEVKLRQLVEGDAEALFALIESSREHLSQFGEDTAKKYPDLESVRKSILNPPILDKLRFGVWNDSVLVGSINLIPAGNAAIIGYWVGADFLRRGYAILAVNAMCAFAASVFRYRNFIAYVHVANEPSKRVLERCGFESAGFAACFSALDIHPRGSSETILVYRYKPKK